ncbi:hypothetical protein GCM10027565_20470 [Bordetella tumulicola]
MCSRTALFANEIIARTRDLGEVCLMIQRMLAAMVRKAQARGGAEQTPGMFDHAATLNAWVTVRKARPTR